MALSQGLGPDLCENRSAPGTPPHGGAGDAPRGGRGPRGSARRTAPAVPRSSRPRCGPAHPGHLPARPRPPRGAPRTEPGARTAGAPREAPGRAGTERPRLRPPGRDALPWRARLGTVPGPPPPGIKSGFYPSRDAFPAMTPFHSCSKRNAFFNPRESGRLLQAEEPGPGQGCCALAQHRAAFLSHCPVPVLLGMSAPFCPLGLPVDTCICLSPSWEPPWFTLAKNNHPGNVHFLEKYVTANICFSSICSCSAIG